jgi:hypothetical protein
MIVMQNKAIRNTRQPSSVNCPRHSTTVESPLQIGPFCTNKPNFRKSQMNVNKVLTKDYEKWHLVNAEKTNPIQTQYKPNQSQLKPIKGQNKPNSNPKRTQSKPIFVPLVLFIVYNCL